MLLVQPHEFKRLAKALGRPDLPTDPRFSSNGRRVRNNDALKEIIETWMAAFPSREAVVAALDKERVPCAPVLSLQEAMDHPHLRERKTVRHASDPLLGEFDLPAMPVKFSDWPDRTDLKASRVGEDNEAVLQEMLGMSDKAITELYAEKVLIKAPAPATASANAS
jgi:crotonobetainyl-CoA:carnitine CoA-transferase CaiB-like acyl-CoA transferase